jgi:arylsulfatase A-like enzyme
LFVAATFSLIVGFLDVNVSLLRGPYEALSLWALHAPWLATTLCFVAFFSASWLGVSFAGSFLALKPLPLAVSTATFIGLIFSSVIAARLFCTAIQRDFFHSPAAASVFTAVGLVVFLAVALAVYRLARATEGNGRIRVLGRLAGLGAPVMLASAAGVIFLCRASKASPEALPFWGGHLSILLSGFAICTGIVFTLLYLIVRKRDPLLPLGIFALLLIAAPFVKLGLSRGGATAKPEAPEKVVLIMGDAVRSDALSCYNENALSTPHIDRLAKDSVLFERAVSAAPWTVPSVTSILTGLSPMVHKAEGVHSRVPDNVETLAEHLKRAGYHTAAVVGNAALWHINLSQGFDDYDMFGRCRSLGEQLLLAFRVEEDLTWAITETGIRRLGLGSPLRQFLWLFYLDPHWPYSPPAALVPSRESAAKAGASLATHAIEGKKAVDGFRAYLGEVRHLDESIGRLLDQMRSDGVYDNSLIVFTSDHGEAFFEHGERGHATALYDEQLLVPLMIKLPGASHKGRASASVSVPRLMPTILEIVGIDPDAGNLSAGSLSAYLGPNAAGVENDPAVSALSDMWTPDGALLKEGVVFDPYKYIRRVDPAEELLFDLSADPMERTSLAPSRRDLVQRGQELLRSHHEESRRLRQHHGLDEGNAHVVDEERMEALKRLGYIQ